MVPDLGSSRGESTTSKIGFWPGNVKERLTRGTERTTGLMVGYEIIHCLNLEYLDEQKQRRCEKFIKMTTNTNRLIN